VRAVAARFGRLDILVNNAGVTVVATIDDADVDLPALDRQHDVNYHGVVAAIRAAIGVLGEGGRIVTIGSGVGTRVGFGGMTDYTATKAAARRSDSGAAVVDRAVPREDVCDPGPQPQAPTRL